MDKTINWEEEFDKKQWFKKMYYDAYGREWDYVLTTGISVEDVRTEIKEFIKELLSKN